MQRVARTSSSSSFLLGFKVSARTSHFLLMRDAAQELRFSCDEDVGDVGEDELEELVDRPGTKNGT